MGSGKGIASMILGIIVAFLNFVVLTALVLTAIRTGSVGVIIAAAIVGLVVLIIAFVGLILGIVGASGDDKKVYGIIGLILCVISLLFVIWAMSIGAAAAGA